MRLRIWTRVCAVALTAAIAPGGLTPACAQQDRYWELGVGAYLGGMQGFTDLDIARYDWVYVCFGNIGATEETAQAIDRMLAINPDLKIVLRLWPIMGKGDCPENRHQATFLHYLYDPEVKAEVDASIHEQFDVIADNISKPENIVGLTFLEELPGHFSGRPMRSGEVSWAMERFREEIEAERGEPLVWDEATALWWGEKWAEAINEIHRVMKEASDGKTIWYYQAVGNTTFDLVPEDTPATQKNLVPIRYEQVVKPGLCEGFFAYPVRDERWDAYLSLAEENDWPFFSQLSHPGFMRLHDWEHTVEMVEARVPQNMGYFLYCPGDCAKKNAWNDDPQFTGKPEHNIRGVSKTLHQRQILARADVGMDVVRAQPALRLHVDLPIEKAEAGGWLHVAALVENVREPSFFLDPAEAVAPDCRVTLTVPDGFTIDEEASAPPTIGLDLMEPGEMRLADWWVSVAEDWDGELAGNFTLTASAAEGAATEVALEEDTAIPLGQPHLIGASGATWIEPGFRLSASAQPPITIEAVRGEVTNPVLTDGRARVAFDGTLRVGQRLIMRPGGDSELLTLPLVADTGSGRADADDPTGFRAFDDGYLVERVRVNRDVTPGETLAVSVAGKAEGGAQSHLVLRFVMEDGSTQDAGALTNRFREDWRVIDGEVTVPEGATQLQQVFLYRFKSEGAVWYGPVSVEARATAEPEDCAQRVSGTFPTIERGGFAQIRYEDDDLATIAPRALVQMQLAAD
ncbi:MAG: hypothetical protein ACOCX2_03565 [Armatimonadota bacterium]